MKPVNNKKILLGVSGGIAAYKAAELIRLLRKEGCTVHVAMTRNATEFITPLTLQALSGNPVWVDTFQLGLEQEIGHIRLVDDADLFLVAPATANIIGKAASGIADDMLSTLLCVASRIPVVFAPSMNVHMYENPITQENIEKLKRVGRDVVEPDVGELACGHQGVGRLADLETIVEEVLFRLSTRDLQGERILVTAGPTQEEIDPVRFLSNPSSGKMGFALARAAARRGAHVTLVTGPTNCTNPLRVKVVSVKSAEQMRAGVLEAFPDTTAVLMTAAVSDYRPVRKAPQKIKKNVAELRLDLEQTPDILRELGTRKGERILIGFAAETESLVQHAEEKLKKKNLDLIVVNDVSRTDIGFQSEQNQVKILAQDGECTELPLMTKEELAHRILDRFLLLRQQGKASRGKPGTREGRKTVPSPTRA
jgi:phosphopantothenoylcysteine decarboxylase / phosphopantothenate---cysteine ligase